MAVVTKAGRPPKIDREYFRSRYGQNFPDLLVEEKDSFLDECIDAVYTMFYGVGELWSHLPREEYCNKTWLCYGLLTGWYIADLFPDVTLGVMSTGGIPLKAKKIGGVAVQFSDRETKTGAVNNADLLKSLKSNSFGAKAYLMIKASGKLNTFMTR